MSARVSRDLERQRRASREERGTGQAEAYAPWIQIRRHDFPSMGRSHFQPSAFMNRHVEVLSDLELSVYLHLQMLYPRDVREQFPLATKGIEPEFERQYPDAQGSYEVAKKLGVKHPMFSRLESRAMSTDFLVTLRAGEKVAVHVKYEADLVKPRNVELRNIEAEYWRQRGVKFEVLTEAAIDRTQIANLHMLNSFRRENVSEVRGLWLKRLISLASFLPMNEVIARMHLELGISPSMLTDRVKFVVATGIVEVDLKRSRLMWTAQWPPMAVAAWAATALLGLEVPS